MAHERNLTPAQAAGLLGVSGSTLRRWSDDYGDRLSEAASPGAGRKRTYTPDDLAVLQRARELLAAGKAPAEVGALLGVVPESLPPTGSALVTLPKIAGDLSQAIEVIGHLQTIAQAQAAEVDRLRAEHDRQAQTLADIQATQAEQATAHAATQAEIAALRDELSALERRGFWDRLLNRKPRPTGSP